MSSIAQAVNEFSNVGSALLPADSMPLDAEEWRQLTRLVQDVEYEKVVGGDTGDAHSVWVGRFINDVKQPEALSPLTPQLLALIMSDKMRKWYARFTGYEQLCLRRCQANMMQDGDFIGYHIDQDTTPDYDVTFIFQISDDYQGGDFVVHHPQSGLHRYHGDKCSIMVNSGSIPHEVTPVSKGCRRTLACFMSRNFGETKKIRQDIKTV